MTERETSAYIADLARELRDMAAARGLRVLAYLLDMVVAEATRRQQ